MTKYSKSKFLYDVWENNPIMKNSPMQSTSFTNGKSIFLIIGSTKPKFYWKQIVYVYFVNQSPFLQ